MILAMNRILSIFVTLVWGIWIGALMGMTLSVITLARSFPPRTDPNFGVAAPPIFALFERMQLGLAAAAVICTFFWLLLGRAKALKTALFVLFALASVGAVAEAAYVAPKINQLRDIRGENQTEFDKYHQMSERIYGGTFFVLLGAGILLPVTIARDERSRRVES